MSEAKREASELNALLCADKKYTEKDMLFAFKHGCDFVKTNMHSSDMSADTPDVNLPFWEWLKRHYT